MIEFRRATVTDDSALTLIRALNAEISLTYPNPEDNFWRLEPADVTEGTGAFLIGVVDGHDACCGAVRRWGDDAAELKRMYVVPQFRGRGISDALVAALEAEARRLGVSRLLLETGPLLTHAIALYERCGFVAIEQFGEYVGSNSSYCMGKDL